ncbi:hypothetical protein AB0940_24735 [Streptomyces sp. NPDC006656]|uniref:hypothetical protein n=1 Tax=Streptomyces sp. NPDC006656 TaxID=3156899 RepID=UPI0034520CA4
MARHVLNRPGRYRHEMLLLLDEYGERKDWPPGVALTFELLCTLEEQLPLVSYQRVLAAFQPPVAEGVEKLIGKDEQLAFMALADALRVLGNFSFGILLSMANEIEEERGPARAA